MTFLCLHAHFYQAPRGDPFADRYGADFIGHEPGAEPYENWNEKVTAECYLPNAELGNFELMSFDVGGPLMRWMQTHAPNTYGKVIEAEHKYHERHQASNALAVSSHHTILPLARKRDKVAQVVWGLESFKHRYGVMPQGMWLPELAVDLETLQILRDLGLKFTVLSSTQVNGATEGAGPYWVKLPSGDHFAVFVRDEELSNQLAFNIQTLGGAGRWVREVLAGRRRHTGRLGQGLLLLAVEGETFGHYHPGEEHFLHWLLSYEASAVGFQITTLERYLRDNLPQHEVTLKEYTSWSCTHGLARYASGCTCTEGNSHWKGALRRAFDNLSNNIDDAYVSLAEQAKLDPWQLRNRYVRVTLGQTAADKFLAEEGLATPQLNAPLSTLLAAGYFRQRMYAAHAFKFDDFTRPESHYAIANALRAALLAKEALGDDFLPALRRDLAQVQSAQGNLTAADVLAQIQAELPSN